MRTSNELIWEELERGRKRPSPKLFRLIHADLCTLEARLSYHNPWYEPQNITDRKVLSVWGTEAKKFRIRTLERKRLRREGYTELGLKYILDRGFRHRNACMYEARTLNAIDRGIDFETAAQEALGLLHRRFTKLKPEPTEVW